MISTKTGQFINFHKNWTFHHKSNKIEKAFSYHFWLRKKTVYGKKHLRKWKIFNSRHEGKMTVFNENLQLDLFRNRQIDNRNVWRGPNTNYAKTPNAFSIIFFFISRLHKMWKLEATIRVNVLYPSCVPRNKPKKNEKM